MSAPRCDAADDEAMAAKLSAARAVRLSATGRRIGLCVYSEIRRRRRRHIRVMAMPMAARHRNILLRR